jgi:hypothetical protein
LNPVRLARIEAWLDPPSIRIFEEHAVQPGGRLIVFDSGGAPPVALQHRELFDRFGMAFLTAAARSGWDLTWAPCLPQRLAELGLVDIRARAFREYVTGSDDGFPAFTAMS